ncbi:hypothetical protein VTO73DRAFT_835 [Trametes versicolor]
MHPPPPHMTTCNDLSLLFALSIGSARLSRLFSSRFAPFLHCSILTPAPSASPLPATLYRPSSRSLCILCSRYRSRLLICRLRCCRLSLKYSLRFSQSLLSRCV